MKFNLALIVLSLVSVSAFAQNSKGLEPANVVQVTATGDIMPSIDGREKFVNYEVVAQVTSGGCTDASSFKAEIKSTEAGQTLTLTRIKFDGCEAYLPGGVAIKIDVTGKGADAHKPIQVANPLLVVSKVTE